MAITLYHNPRCSKSRQTLALLEANGHQPILRLYLETAPSVAELSSLLDKLGMAPRALLRTKEAAYRDTGLDDPSRDDAAVLATIAAHPILMERPIVVHGDRAAIGRPPEQVLDIL